MIEVLAEQVGGAPHRLTDLGLLDPHPDPLDPTRVALRANPLAAGRVTPLTAQERAALAAIAIDPLLEVWGASTSSTVRAKEVAVQVTGLALLAEHPGGVATSAAAAVWALGNGPAASAAALGEQAIGLLDRDGHTVPVNLSRATAQVAFTGGHGALGDALLARDTTEHRRASGRGAVAGGSPGDRRTGTALDHHRGARPGRAVAQSGTPPLHDRRSGSRSDDGDGWHHRHRLSARGLRRGTAHPPGGGIAGLRATGRHPRTAVIWGRIADIAYQRGEYDEARSLQMKQLDFHNSWVISTASQPPPGALH